MGVTIPHGVKKKPSRARLTKLIQARCGNLELIGQDTGFKPATVRKWLREWPELAELQKREKAKAKLNSTLRTQHQAFIPVADAKRLLSIYYHEIENLPPNQLKEREAREEIARVNNLVDCEGVFLVRSKSPGQSERMAPSTGQTLQAVVSWADVRTIVERLREQRACGFIGWHDYVLRVWCSAFRPYSTDNPDAHEYANRPEPTPDDTEDSVRELLKALEAFI